MSLEDRLVAQFVAFMNDALPYVQENSVHGSYYRNLGLFGAGMFPGRKDEILKLLKSNAQVREEKPQVLGTAMEGNTAGPLRDNPVVVTESGIVTSGSDGEAGCDSCGQNKLIA